MCLVLIAWRVHPSARDRRRQSRRVLRPARFAAVTNFRELEQGPADARSRGELVVEHSPMDDASWQQREFPIGST